LTFYSFVVSENDTFSGDQTIRYIVSLKTLKHCVSLRLLFYKRALCLIERQHLSLFAKFKVKLVLFQNWVNISN